MKRRSIAARSRCGNATLRIPAALQAMPIGPIAVSTIA